MKRKSAITKKKNRRGRPSTGKGELLGVRIHPPQFVALDSWIAQQQDKPSRPEAVRRLLEFALAQLSDPNKQAAQKKASEIAANTADRLVDKSIPAEEQARRKRALIEGPKEFRDIREDLPMGIPKS
jgi:hypothetical protein